MGARDGYAPGIPSWVDLATGDVDGAKAFYGELFGWESVLLPTGDLPGTYTMFLKGGHRVAGLGVLPDDAAPPVWSTYVAVEDVDAVVGRVLAAGGAVVMPAMDVMDSGRMAFIADPTGASLGLWQAGSHIGAELVNEPGTYTWSELLTDDADAAREFLTEVFGYRAETADTPAGPYTTFWADGNLEGHAAAGMMAKTPQMGALPNHWGVYFCVDDVDASAGKAARAGGGVVAGPMNVPGIGRIAVIRDPQGGVFSVMSYERAIG